tara:strand:- start:330 stop:671 length:342 start_codon:yes stop_codon:yes gene_type:complete
MHTELKSMMAALLSVCVNAVKDAIEDAGMAAGNVTQSFLQTALSQIINNALDQRGITASAASTLTLRCRRKEDTRSSTGVTAASSRTTYRKVTSSPSSTSVSPQIFDGFAALA